MFGPWRPGRRGARLPATRPHSPHRGHMSMNPSTRRVARMASLGALAVALGVAMLPQSATARTDDARADGDRLDLRQAYDRVAERRDVVRLDLLAFNDFHGNLAPISSSQLQRADQQHAGRRRRVPGDPPEEAPEQGPRQRRRDADRRRRGPRRCLPAAVGGVPRRAHHRGHERARARRLRGRQPRVRRGLQGAAAAAARWLHRRRRRRQQPGLLPRRQDVRGLRTSSTSPPTW